MQRWLDQAGEIEAAILSTAHLDDELVNAAGVALDQRRAHLRLVVDLLAPESPRLRVRVIGRHAWWLADSWGCDAPRLKHIRAGLALLDVQSSRA
ncbi:MAG: hypothetical protein ROZ64_18240 [Burkholderiaceae bacterium]|nr:hypothetical protein [Burkholderiaceae bacterium]